MWHILEKYGRKVARKVDAEYAEWLRQRIGGEVCKNHEPATYDEKLEHSDRILGYASNKKPIYAYGQIEVEADGRLVATVTRKKDAFSIMHALKRDYKDIVVRLK